MYQSKEVAEQMQVFLTSSVEEARNLSHAFLLSFQSSPEAWGICRELMHPATAQIPLILSSQIFYQKLQSEFSSLTTPQKIELKVYLSELVLMNFSCSQMFKKICQSIAFVGIIGMNSFWEDFMIDTLRIPKLEVLLEIIHCIPFCLEEFSLSKKTIELLKTNTRKYSNDYGMLVYNIKRKRIYKSNIRNS